MLLPLLSWVPLVASPKHESRLLYVHSCSMPPREIILVVINWLNSYTVELVLRGIGGSPRMMVRHACVVVGAASYDHGTIRILLY